MARFVGSVELLLCVLFCFLARSSALENPGGCEISAIPVVRNLSELGSEAFGRPGLSHMTIAGAVLHGMKEIEVWMQTFAPNSGTPIHRHNCEEVFITLKGFGTLYLSPGYDPDRPGTPLALSLYPNATFTIPVDAVHQIKVVKSEIRRVLQVRNTKEEDLQLFVTISRPPMKSFKYNDWSTSHHEAVYESKEWDKKGQSPIESQQCKEPEAEDDEVMANIAKLLGTSIQDIVISDEIR